MGNLKHNRNAESLPMTVARKRLQGGWYEISSAENGQCRESINLSITAIAKMLSALQITGTTLLGRCLFSSI